MSLSDRPQGLSVVLQIASFVLSAIIMVRCATADPLTLKDIEQGQKFSDQQGDGGPKITKSTQSTLFYSPWERVCTSEQGPARHAICFTTAIGRSDTGVPVFSVALIEPKGGEKIFRVTVPLGVQLPAGTRLAIDQKAPVNAPYIVCDEGGCLADYKADDTWIRRLEAGQRLFVQAIRKDGQIINYVLPLADFSNAYTSPPIGAKVFSAQQKKIQEELQKFAAQKHEGR